MKTILLVLTLIGLCAGNALAGEVPTPKADLNIGIYYTFKPDNLDEFKKETSNLVAEISSTINSFFPKKILNFNISFFEYWETPYKSVFEDDIFKMLNASQKPNADFYVVLIDTKLLLKSKKGDASTRIAGRAQVGGDEIIIADFLDITSDIKMIVFIHELGHTVGLSHPPSENCEKEPVLIMCSNAPDFRKIILNSEFLQAFYDFYLNKIYPPDE